jgi:hypothetical protein
MEFLDLEPDRLREGPGNMVSDDDEPKTAGGDTFIPRNIKTKYRPLPI